MNTPLDIGNRALQVMPDPEGRARASWPHLFEPSPFKADPNAVPPPGVGRTTSANPNAPQAAVGPTTGL